MSDPTDPIDPAEPGERSANQPAPGNEPFLFRIIRTAIAPPVLEDGGHDAPLSPRGRLVFSVVVSVLVVAIAVLFVITLSR